MKNKLGIIFVFILFMNLYLTGTRVAAQTPDNYSVINQLIDSTVSLVLKKTELTRIKIIIPDSYAVLEPRAKSAFSLRGFVLTSNSDSADIILSIEKISLTYAVEKSGLFGADKAKRIAVLSAFYILDNIGEELNAMYDDLIDINDIDRLESAPFPFAKGERPESSSFFSIFTPVAAITAIGISIAVFFYVRSK